MCQPLVRLRLVASRHGIDGTPLQDIFVKVMWQSWRIQLKILGYVARYILFQELFQLFVLILAAFLLGHPWLSKGVFICTVMSTYALLSEAFCERVHVVRISFSRMPAVSYKSKILTYVHNCRNKHSSTHSSIDSTINRSKDTHRHRDSADQGEITHDFHEHSPSDPGCPCTRPHVWIFRWALRGRVVSISHCWSQPASAWTCPSSSGAAWCETVHGFGDRLSWGDS